MSAELSLPIATIIASEMVDDRHSNICEKIKLMREQVSDFYESESEFNQAIGPIEKDPQSFTSGKPILKKYANLLLEKVDIECRMEAEEEAKRDVNLTPQQLKADVKHYVAVCEKKIVKQQELCDSLQKQVGQLSEVVRCLVAYPHLFDGNKDDIQTDINRDFCVESRWLTRGLVERASQSTHRTVMSELPLLPGWAPIVDAVGRTYFWSSSTGETTWTRPEAADINEHPGSGEKTRLLAHCAMLDTDALDYFIGRDVVPDEEFVVPTKSCPAKKEEAASSSDDDSSTTKKRRLPKRKTNTITTNPITGGPWSDGDDMIAILVEAHALHAQAR